MHELAEDQCLVEPAKTSVIDHIQDLNCINLLALITDDSSNSNATVLIKLAKVKSRSAGFLTRPDRIQHWGSVSQLVRVLENKTCFSSLGYFVVENNSNPLVDYYVTQFPGRKRGIISQSTMFYRFEAVQE